MSKAINKFDGVMMFISLLILGSIPAIAIYLGA